MLFIQDNAIYLIQASVTNMSTRGGQPSAAHLRVIIAAWIGVGLQVVGEATELDFAPGETRIIEANLDIPPGSADSGEVAILVYSPTGEQIALLSEFLTIVAGPAPPLSTKVEIRIAGVNDLAARLGIPIKFQMIGIWSSGDSQMSVREAGLYESSWIPPEGAVFQPGYIVAATEGMQLIYDIDYIGQYVYGQVACGGWVLHGTQGWVAAILINDFPGALAGGQIWEWNISTGSLVRLQ